MIAFITSSLFSGNITDTPKKVADTRQVCSVASSFVPNTSVCQKGVHGGLVTVHLHTGLHAWIPTKLTEGMYQEQELFPSRTCKTFVSSPLNSHCTLISHANLCKHNLHNQDLQIMVQKPSLSLCTFSSCLTIRQYNTTRTCKMIIHF